MKKLILAAFAIVSISLLPAEQAGAQSKGKQDADISHMLTGFSAKETCSCVFAVGQSDAYCKLFGQQEGFSSIAIVIDHTGKKVSATYSPPTGTSVTRSATATTGQGCQLDAY
jgi:hypothetical protein